MAACKACNHRKGGRTPEEARLRLTRVPFEPRSDLYSVFTPYLEDDRNEGWRELPLPRPQLTRAVTSAEAAAERLAGIVPAPVVEVLDRLNRAGHAGYVVGGSRARRAPRPRGRGLGPRHRCPARAPRRAVPRRGVREPLRDRGDPARGRRVRGHDLPDRARVRGLPAPAPGRVRRRHRRGPRPSRLHGERHRLGPRGRGGWHAPRWSTRSTAWRTSTGGSCGRSATRTRGSARTPCAWSGPCGSRRRSASRSSPRRWPRSARTPGWPPTCRASGSAPSWRSCSRHPSPRAGLRLAAETGLLAILAPDLAAQRGIAQNKHPGEDLWDHTLRTVDAAPGGRPVVRLAALVHDIGKPSTLADGHFHHHDVVGRRDRLGLAAPPPVPACRRRRRRPPRAPPHVRRRPDAVRRGRAAVPQAGRRAPPRQPVRAPARGRHRLRDAARRPGDPAASASGSTPSSPRRRRSTATRSSSTATT